MGDCSNSRRSCPSIPGPRGPPGICDITSRNLCEKVKQCSGLLEDERPEINSVMSYESPLPLIAFTVGLKDQNFTIGDNKETPDTVLFDYEALNENSLGNGPFSMQKGRFTAPISGVYSLSMTVLQNDKKIPTFVSMIESRSKRLCTITTQSIMQQLDVT